MAARPNVLILVLDAGRPDYLGCYGCPLPTTPYIDSVAAQSSLFEHASTVAPWTVPSHGSMFTGLLPSQHGANWNTLQIRPGIPTLFQIFAENGYDVSAFVANGNLVYPRLGYFREETRLYHGVQGQDTGGERPEVSEFVRGFDSSRSNCYRILEYFQDWSSKHFKTPFFAFMNMYDLHTKYDALPPHRSRFVTAKDEQVLAGIGEIFALHFKEMNREVEVTPEQVEALRHLYAAKMASLDDAVKGVLGELEAKGVLDDTLLLITSDHGDTLGDHTFPSFHHQFSIYNALTWVPMIWRAPGRVTPRRTGRLHAQLTDVAPTVLEWAGIPVPEQLSTRYGVSLMPWLEGKRDEPVRSHSIAMYEAPHRFVNWNKKNVDRSYIRPLYACWDDRYKVIFSDDGRQELYDIVNDPKETKDICPGLRDIAQTLQEKFFEIVGLHGGMTDDYDLPEWSAEEESEIEGRLRDLGYIE